MFRPITIILFIHFLDGSLSSESCLPQTCNGLNIKKPFWISGRQESHCGLPEFNITCHDNEPLIKISGDSFIIKQIYYQNHSFLLAKSDVFDPGNQCPTPRVNFSVDGTPFRYGPDATDLFFFYNCSMPYERENYPVNCSGNRYSFAVFHVEVLEHWNYSVESCQSQINAPVETDGLKNLLKMNFTEILKKRKD